MVQCRPGPTLRHTCSPRPNSAAIFFGYLCIDRRSGWRSEPPATAPLAAVTPGRDEVLDVLDTGAQITRLERLILEPLAEMRDDLAASPFTREFVLSFWNGGTAFEYTSADEPTLRSKVQILEHMGLVRDITNKNVQRYRMTEEFVEHLTGG